MSQPFDEETERLLANSPLGHCRRLWKEKQDSLPSGMPEPQWTQAETPNYWIAGSYRVNLDEPVGRGEYKFEEKMFLCAWPKEGTDRNLKVWCVHLDLTKRQITDDSLWWSRLATGYHSLSRALRNANMPDDAERTSVAALECSRRSREASSRDESPKHS